MCKHHLLYFCNYNFTLPTRVIQHQGDVGISPKGTTIFVSNLYTGAISYKEITRCSGILDLYEPDDSVMADKGFEIEDLLKEKNVALNLPSFFQ